MIDDREVKDETLKELGPWLPLPGLSRTDLSKFKDLAQQKVQHDHANRRAHYCLATSFAVFY